MQRNIIILGPPGSGKGTQAKILAQKLNLIYFGTGDLMRQEAKKETDLGKKFEDIWQRNKAGLIPDELVDELVQRKISELDGKREIIFDGYPRTLAQAEALRENVNLKNILVLNIKVSAESLIYRMGTRKVCSACGQIFPAPPADLKDCPDCGGKLIQRQDDKPEVIRQRISIYEEQTKPLISYFQREGKLIEIDGEPPIAAVEKEIWEKIKNVY